VLVHIEPIASPGETTAEAIRATALRLGIATHHEQVYQVGDRLEAVLHVEVDPHLTLAAAHARVSDLTESLIAEVSGLNGVAVHIEAGEPNAAHRRNVTDDRADVVDAMRNVMLRHGATSVEIRLYTDGSGWDAVLECLFPGDLVVVEIHRRTERLEQELREHFPDLGRVIIRAKPAENEAGLHSFDVT
jgi:divalent metal cation (Fe/Co/Zn/Cd) transporter